MIRGNAAFGVDIGNSVFIIGMVSKGGVEVLTNEVNSRTTPTLISYGQNR